MIHEKNRAEARIKANERAYGSEFKRAYEKAELQLEKEQDGAFSKESPAILNRLVDRALDIIGRPDAYVSRPSQPQTSEDGFGPIDHRGSGGDGNRIENVAPRSTPKSVPVAVQSQDAAREPAETGPVVLSDRAREALIEYGVRAESVNSFPAIFRKAAKRINAISEEKKRYALSRALRDTLENLGVPILDHSFGLLAIAHRELASREWMRMHPDAKKTPFDDEDEVAVWLKAELPEIRNPMMGSPLEAAAERLEEYELSWNGPPLERLELKLLKILCIAQSQNACKEISVSTRDAWKLVSNGKENARMGSKLLKILCRTGVIQLLVEGQRGVPTPTKKLRAAEYRVDLQHSSLTFHRLTTQKHGSTDS